MKRAFYFFAVAALACVTACQREVLPEAEAPENETSFTFVSAKPVLEEEISTRTEWTGETIQWSKDDQIRVAYTVAGVWQGASDSNTAPKLYASDKLKAAAEIAEFNVNTNFTSTATGTHVFYGLYPSSLASSTSFDDAPVAAISIPIEQEPSADSFDGAADVMIGVSEELDEKPSSEETVLMSWTRLVAHADLTIKNLTINEGETIDKITLTAQEGADLVGMHSLNLVTGEFSNAQGATNEIVIKAQNLTYANKTIKVWASMLPATLTELTVTVETDKAYYVRSFSGFTREFKQNKHNTMNIGMTSAVRTEKAANLGDYEETFGSSMGEFTIKNVDLGGLSYVWSYDSYHYAKASAYASNSAHAATSYLVSPELTIGSNNSKLTFDQAANKFDGATVSDYFSVVVFEGENETPLELDVMPAGNSWTFVTSTASLSSFNGKKIKIGFKYTSTTSVAGTWEIKNFKVTDVKTKLAAGLSFGENTAFEIELGDDFTPPTLINPNNLAVTYDSSDDEIAEVDETTGAVTMGEKAGTVTITATFEGNDDYNEGSASYTIKVVDPNATSVTDVINRAFTGIAAGANYGAWSGKTGLSGAVYAGQSAGYNTNGADAIQLRSNNNNSGIITTTSGGHVAKVTVVWNSATTDGRTLDVYGKTSAYEAATDLYNSSKQGTLIGSIVKGTTTSFEVSGDYTFIGLRSNSGAMYIDEIQIEWSSVAAPAIPVITLSNLPTSSISADGDVVSFNYSIENSVEGVTVQASAGSDTWVNSFDYSKAGEISFVVDANTATSTRSATITISYTGAESKTFQITQEGASSGNEKTLEFTYSSHDGWTISSGADDKNSYYLLKNSSYIDSPEFTFSSSKAVKVTLRSFGGVQYGPIDIKYGDTVIGSQNSATSSLTEYTINVTSPSAGTGALRFIGQNTTTANGPGISKIVITYE